MINVSDFEKDAYSSDWATRKRSAEVFCSIEVDRVQNIQRVLLSDENDTAVSESAFETCLRSGDINNQCIACEVYYRADDHAGDHLNSVILSLKADHGLGVIDVNPIDIFVSVYKAGYSFEASEGALTALEWLGYDIAELIGPNLFCCDVMKSQLEFKCDTHSNLLDCPDVILLRIGANQIVFPIRDGGSSFINLQYCPWCGTSKHKLAISKD